MENTTISGSLLNASLVISVPIYMYQKLNMEVSCANLSRSCSARSLWSNSLGEVILMVILTHGIFSSREIF
jgi:hypothetical protein